MADHFENMNFPCDPFNIARVLNPSLFKYFNGNLHLRVNVNTLLDFSKRAPSNSLLEFIVTNLYLIYSGSKRSLGRKLLVVP